MLSTDFLMPLSVHELNEDQGYNEGQLASHIRIHEQHMPDIDAADIVLLGITENRGEGTPQHFNNAANIIRKHLYRLHYWHTDTQIADIGNVKIGATLADSYAAIQSEVAFLISKGKTVVLMGGSHDVTLAQYNAYKQLQRVIEVACIDASIDLSNETPVPAHNFLMELLTSCLLYTSPSPRD